MKEIKETGADVICLQEVDELANFYEPELEKLGFKIIHYKRPGFWKGDGIAIAYRRSVVTLMTTEFVDLDDLVAIYGARRFSQGNQGMFCLF